MLSVLIEVFYSNLSVAKVNSLENLRLFYSIIEFHDENYSILNFRCVDWHTLFCIVDSPIPRYWENYFFAYRGKSKKGKIAYLGIPWSGKASFGFDCGPVNAPKNKRKWPFIIFVFIRLLIGVSRVMSSCVLPHFINIDHKKAVITQKW